MIDPTPSTFTGFFIFLAFSWAIGAFLAVDIIVTWMKGTTAYQRYQPTKFYLSWYLYLHGAGSLVMAILHRHYADAEAIRAVHTVACVCYVLAAGSLLCVAVNYYHSGQDLREIVGAAVVMPQAPAGPIELPGRTIRWVVGPDNAFLPWCLVAVGIAAGFVIAVAVVGDPTVREQLTLSMWAACTAIAAAPVLARLILGSEIPENPTTHRATGTATFYVIGVCTLVCFAVHFVALVIALQQAAPCNSEKRSGCLFTGAFSYRALFCVLGVFGDAVLLPVPLSMTIPIPPNKVQPASDADAGVPLVGVAAAPATA